MAGQENEAQAIDELEHLAYLEEQRRAKAAAKPAHKKRAAKPRRPSVPTQAGAPGATARSASATVPREGLPKRPRRPVFTQGTSARRHRLALMIQRLRALRSAHAQAVRAGAISPATYGAAWGHGDKELRSLAEYLVRNNLNPSDSQIYSYLRHETPRVTV